MKNTKIPKCVESAITRISWDHLLTIPIRSAVRRHLENVIKKELTRTYKNGYRAGVNAAGMR